MNRFTVEQRVVIVKIYYKNGESSLETLRKLRTIFGRQNVPDSSTIRRIIEKFEQSGSVTDVKTLKRPRNCRSAENIVAVSESVARSPRTSIRRRSQQLNISRSTMQRILTKDLHLHPYKLQLTQQLLPTDHLQRREFADWVFENQNMDNNFARNIIFSDEAHFQLDGYVNKHNCRIWGDENPHITVQLPKHPPRVTVWCGFWAGGGVIGPYFFENAAGNALTVNGVRYRKMISEFFWPQLERMDLENMWFQQDGATCHTARETIELLQEKFPGRVISRHGDQNWPPRSCDMTPCDFFLWGYVKSRVYANNPRTIPVLKDEIERVIAEIEPQMCENVITNFLKRVRVCQQSLGGHLSDIVFHT